MKKLIAILFLLGTFSHSFAQLDAKGQHGDMVVISVSANKTFFGMSDFNTWTRQYFNLKERYLLNPAIDIGIIGSRYTLGLNAAIPSPFGFVSGYFGRRLTGNHAKISSWLNLEIGGFSGHFTNISPLAYMTPIGENDKKFEMRYRAGFIGLTSKNYLDFTHSNLKLGKARILINSGFTASVGLMPFKRTWRYGYYENDSTFVAQKYNSIPKLGRVYGNVGVFVGF
ncbi:MAG TPA: hypothetical protein VIM55_12120 [Mucilaginibacter sp.]